MRGICHFHSTTDASDPDTWTAGKNAHGAVGRQFARDAIPANWQIPPMRHLPRFHRLLGLALLAALAFRADARDEATEYNRAVRTTTVLHTTTTVSGAPLVYPQTGPAEVSGLVVELPPGAETGWHRHTVPCFAYILSGTIAVEQKDGPTRTFHAGEAFAELVDILHNGRTVGDEPVRLVFFAAGVQGQPFTVKATAVK